MIRRKGVADLPLAVVGLDYKTASSAYRAELIAAPEEREELFAALKKIDSTVGFMAVETCNRVEWIVSGPEIEWLSDLLSANMLSRLERSREEGASVPSPFVYLGSEAAARIFRTVTGLESFVPGEAQIAGQFQKALIAARKENAASIVLNGLGGIAGRAAKFSYKAGFQSNHRRGIHGLALKFIDLRFGEKAGEKKIAVLGMGEIGRKSAAVIEEAFSTKVVRFNRTIPGKNRGEWLPLKEIRGLSASIDALIIATGAPGPTLLRSDIAPAAERSEPLVILDIGIPRQAESGVEEARNIDYNSIDDLMKINLDAVDREAYQKVEGEIEKYVQQFRRFCLEKDMISLLDRTRKRHREFSERLVPQFIETHFQSLDEAHKKRVEAELKKLFRNYTNDMFDSIHTAIEEYWSKK